MSISENGVYVCDYCGGDQGRFDSCDGNHLDCKEIASLKEDNSRLRGINVLLFEELQRYASKKRKRWGYKTVRAIYCKTGGKCYYCGEQLEVIEHLDEGGRPVVEERLWVIDHLVPLSRGGEDEIDNCVPSCSDCNSSKGSKLLSEWKKPGLEYISDANEMLGKGYKK
jgi:CRISPR/Cas system Type II protein with McrA/HNH and RuvC-like nuclease domain